MDANKWSQVRENYLLLVFFFPNRLEFSKNYVTGYRSML
jgi:hypothetical protein